MEVEHEATAYLVVENHGDKALYVILYDLGPSWQVENIYKGASVVVEPRSERKSFKGTIEKKL